MNIFILADSPQESAEMHCDKHVCKMMIEYAQMLSTAHRVLDGDAYADLIGLYKVAHKNHPSTVWVRSSVENYIWLYNHMVALMKEYTYRYDKHHATEKLIVHLKKPPIMLLETLRKEFTSPPQCMPDYCKGVDTVSAYQTYYILEKSDFATWKRRDKPEWMNEERGLLGLHGPQDAGRPN